MTTLQMAADEAAAHEGGLLESAADKNLDRYWSASASADDDFILGVGDGDGAHAALLAGFEAHK
jgi:hypothetical protein